MQRDRSMKVQCCRTKQLFIISWVFAAASAASGQVIYEDYKLLMEGGSEFKYFGNAVDMAEGVVAVGQNAQRVGDFTKVYIIDSVTGAELFEFAPIATSPVDLFGSSIALSNGLLAAGAPGDDTNGASSGAAYVFHVASGAQFAKLLPSDGVVGQNFGNAISIDNDTVAVGSFKDSNGPSRSGSAYLFNKFGVQLFKLTPSDRTREDEFGVSISIDDGIVAVGSHLDDDNGDQSGSVYLFDAATGEEIFKFLPDDGESGDLFGTSVSIDNGIIAIGAPGKNVNWSFGAVYLFDVATGEQLRRLTPSVSDSFGFGRDVSIDSGIVAVGDYQYQNLYGTAYLFDIATGEQLYRLFPSDRSPIDMFGTSVAIDSGVVAIGCPRDDDNGDNSGSVYMYDINCPADTNHDGDLTPADFTAWIAAFNAATTECDQNGDGSCTPADFTAWIANFNAGCL